MSERIFGVVGLFDSADALMAAIPRLKEKNLGRLEAYTPYPVHGLEKALGLRRSPVGGMVMVMGALGALSGLVLEWWANVHDYPTVTGGKPLFSWQAFVPVMFEVTVLFATFTAGLAMLFLLNKLPFFGHPILSSKAIRAITRDRFGLSIEADGSDLDVEDARQALLAAGAAEVEALPMPEVAGPMSARFLTRTALGIAISCAVAGYGTYWGTKLFPALPPMIHMEEQPKLNAQESSAFFRDGHGMQLPADGAVARGHMPYLFASQDEAASLVNPLPRSPQVMAEGKRVYENRCVVCHGPLGDGHPTLTSAYGAKPADLQSQTFREYPDGKIYFVIVRGKGAMPSYAGELTPDERWAVIHYVRALQRAQDASASDLKGPK